MFTGLPNDLTINVIDDDFLVLKSLAGADYIIAEHAQTFETGKILLENSRSDSEVILVDNRLEMGKFGTELIGQQLRRKNIYLCTNDYDDMDLIKQARSIGVKVLPKPLIFLRLAQTLQRPAMTSSLNRIILWTKLHRKLGLNLIAKLIS